MDHAIRAATAQAPATVEGLMELVLRYGANRYGEGIEGPDSRWAASDANASVESRAAIKAYASRLAAPPAPPQEPPKWQDKRDRWSAMIDAAHPMNSGNHDAYSTAMEMVGNRRSKGDLVDLVSWLVWRADDSEERLQRATSPPPPLEPQEVEMLTDEEILRALVEELKRGVKQRPNEVIQRAFAKKAGLRVKEGA